MGSQTNSATGQVREKLHKKSVYEKSNSPLRGCLRLWEARGYSAENETACNWKRLLAKEGGVFISLLHMLLPIFEFIGFNSPVHMVKEPTTSFSTDAASEYTGHRNKFSNHIHDREVGG